MKDTTQIQINFQVLVWARESIALSKNYVSEQTGISISRLAQLENGTINPAIEELKMLSKVYKRTIATLLLDIPPKEKPLPKDRRTVDSKELNHFHEKTILAIRKARALADSFLELRNELGISTNKFNLSATLQDEPKIVGDQIRNLLNISKIHEFESSNTALEYCIEKIEGLGVFVFQLSLTKDNVRGFAITDDEVPIVGIKRGQEKPQSKIFTLFHELGHIILNQSGICDMIESTSVEVEKWCNSFSASVLIPTELFLHTELVKKHIEENDMNWTLKDLILLSKEFHISPLAGLRTLLENQLVTKEFYQERHNKWNKPTFGRSKHPEGRNLSKEAIQEKGKTYVTLAFSAYDRNRIDLKDLSDFLGVKLSYISKTRQLLYS